MFSPFMLIRWLLIGLVVYLSSCVLMVVLARRLPSGLLRDVAAFLPACVTAARRLRRSPEVPRRAKVALPRSPPAHHEGRGKVRPRPTEPGSTPGWTSARGSAADPP